MFLMRCTLSLVSLTAVMVCLMNTHLQLIPLIVGFFAVTYWGIGTLLQKIYTYIQNHYLSNQVDGKEESLEENSEENQEQRGWDCCDKILSIPCQDIPNNCDCPVGCDMPIDCDCPSP